MPRGHFAAVGLDIADLGLVAEDQARIQNPAVEVVRQSRQIEIGVLILGRAGIDGLEVIDQSVDRAEGALVIQRSDTGDVAVIDQIQRRAELVQVVEIGNPVAVDVSGELLGETRVVAEADLAAGGAGEVIMRQDVADEATARHVVQVAELVAQHETALGQVARHGSVVVVRRQVEIIGDRQIDAADLRDTEVGAQQTGDAAVVDREIHVGRVQEGHVHELEPGPLRGALAGLAVDLDLVGMQQPILITGRATGVGEILVTRQGVAVDVGQARGSAAGQCRHDQLGIAKHPPPRLAIQEAGVAGQDHALVLVGHVAVDVDGIVLDVAGNVISPELLVGLHHFRRAGEIGYLSVDEFEIVRVDVGRRRFAGGFLLRGQNELRQRRRPLLAHLGRATAGPGVGRQPLHHVGKAVLIFPGNRVRLRPVFSRLAVLADDMGKPSRVAATERAVPALVRAVIEAGFATPAGRRGAWLFALGFGGVEGSLAAHEVRFVLRAVGVVLGRRGCIGRVFAQLDFRLFRDGLSSLNGAGRPAYPILAMTFLRAIPIGRSAKSEGRSHGADDRRRSAPQARGKSRWHGRQWNGQALSSSERIKAVAREIGLLESAGWLHGRRQRGFVVK